MKKYIVIFICLLMIVFEIFYFKFYTVIEVTIDDIELNFNDKANISDYVKVKNGKVYDHEIVTTILGKSNYQVKVENKYHYQKEYTYEVNIVDKIAPVIFVNNTYTVYAPYDGDILDSIMIGDNDTNIVTKELIGQYDGNVIGEYPLKIIATDESLNVTEKEFILIVKEKESSFSNEITYNDFSLYKEKYKDNKVGIDVSKWQGTIDFQKVKEDGADFVILRIGVQSGYGKENTLDSHFLENIKNATSVGLDIGLYFYSCATSIKEAKDQAKWVINQIDDYKITLPIAFDWENWNNFNEANLSFYSLTEIAKSFMNQINKNGYDALLYGSKNYLENIWLDTDYPVWLAHYTDETNYKGNYQLWQITENGKIDGIDGKVDIDILY